MIPVVVTSVVLQFMPDIIPMHHDLEGNTDRWGSKTESFIFPVIILFITLFWHLLIYVFEKKSKNANTEKEQMEAKSSAKVLCVVGISQAIMFGIMHYFILYSSWIQANAGGEHAVSLRTPSWAEDWIVFCRCVPHLSGKPHEPCRRAGEGQKLSAILVCGSA